MAARTSLKAQIIELSDAGCSPTQVWHALRCNREYVQWVISHHSTNSGIDARANDDLRQQTRDFRALIVAAGGHETVPEMRGCR